MWCNNPEYYYEEDLEPEEQFIEYYDEYEKEFGEFFIDMQAHVKEKLASL